jgi:cytochrome c peroxidase
MHDGSLSTLEEVVEFYNRGGGANPNRDSVLGPLRLSKEEVRALVAFLKAL